MKQRIISRLKKPLLAALVGTVALSGAALAYTSSTFQSGADSYVSLNCGGLLSGVAAPLCFSVLGVEELGTALATTNANVATNTSSIATNTSNISANTTAIASLSASVSGQATTVGGLSSAVSGLSSAVAAKTSLVLYDSGNNLLGLTSVRSDDGMGHFFDAPSGTLISYDASTGNLTDSESIVDTQAEYFSGTGCTGSSYALLNRGGAVTNILWGQGLPIGPAGPVYKLTTNVPTGSMTTSSKKSWNGSSVVCTTVSTTGTYAASVDANVTFTAPIAFPTAIHAQ